MDFDLSDSQRSWQDESIAFARRELQDDIAGRDERREFWREGWDRCARFGIQGLPVPETYGGRGAGLPETIAAMEGLGYACPDAGLIFALNACLWTNTLPILTYGTEPQRLRWLPGLCDGSIVGANGASEEEAGSDIFNMTTTAVRSNGGWVLDGRKTWITSGPVADLFVLYATTAPGRGVMGVSAFLVPRETAGFRSVRSIPKLGVRTVPMGEVELTECRLPADALLGREGRGGEVFNASMEWERGAILAGTLGAMRRQLERCVARAKSRRQFGQPIGKFQAVSHRIVEMALRLETCRPLVYKIGWMKSRGDDATMASAMAKLHVSRCSVENSLAAVELFGALGYADESGLGRDLRDSVGSLIYSGTNDIQKNLIARSLGL